jgi:hypothetical protein
MEDMHKSVRAISHDYQGHCIRHGQTYDPQIVFNSRGQKRGIFIPDNISRPPTNDVQVISSHCAGGTNDVSKSEDDTDSVSLRRAHF